MKSKVFFSLKGGIVPEVSWPLSRFEKGKTEVTISFAVKGAAELSAVSLNNHGVIVLTHTAFTKEMPSNVTFPSLTLFLPLILTQLIHITNNLQIFLAKKRFKLVLLIVDTANDENIYRKKSNFTALKVALSAYGGALCKWTGIDLAETQSKACSKFKLAFPYLKYAQCIT